MTNDMTFWRLLALVLVVFGACAAMGGLIFAAVSLFKAVLKVVA